MATLTTETGLPLLDGTGLDLVLQDGAGQVLQDGAGNLLILGGSGSPLDDGVVTAAPSTTDAPGMAARLRAALPARWFGDDAPVLTAVLQGLGAIWAALYSQITFTQTQTRLTTATGAFLDMAALDFLGGAILRKVGQPDADFSAQLRREIVRPRATRAALVQLVTDLTGRSVHVFEPGRPADTGGYDVGGVGYDVGGGYGSLLTPCQVFVDATRAAGAGIPNSGGWDMAIGYDAGGGGYASLAQISGGVTDDELMAAITGVLPVGVTAWVRLSAGGSAGTGAWDTAVWDQSTWA